MVLITVPDAACAEVLAGALLEERVAACVNIVSGIDSHYRWQGQIERAPECLLIVKTVNKALPDLERVVRQKHPYECPEILAMSVSAGSSDYLSWLRGAIGT